MKRNRLFILGIVTVLVALLSLTLVSGTFAKYTSSATGSDSARVAKYHVTYKGTGDTVATNVDGSTIENLTFNLFNTVKDSNGTDDESDIANLSDPADGKTVIAPGTSGSFQFELQNLSEVTVKYELAYTLTNSQNIPVEFSLNGTSGWTTNLASLNTAEAQTLAISSAATPVTVYWRWSYEPMTGWTDAKDTELGVAAQTGAVEITVNVQVTFTQVD